MEHFLFPTSKKNGFHHDPLKQLQVGQAAECAIKGASYWRPQA